MSDLTKRLCRPGYDLQKEQAIQEAIIEIRELRAKVETAENDAAHQKALAASALRVAEGWERKCGELRAKIEAMERQEPVGEIQRANSTGNYICSEVWVPLPVGSKLYALPGAQPAPGVRPAALYPVISWLRNGCDPMKAADELEILAAAPEAKP